MMLLMLPAELVIFEGLLKKNQSKKENLSYVLILILGTVTFFNIMNVHGGLDECVDFYFCNILDLSG